MKEALKGEYIGVRSYVNTYAQTLSNGYERINRKSIKYICVIAFKYQQNMKGQLFSLIHY